jgi:hypothetical protein
MAGGTDITFTSDRLRNGGQWASATADAAGAVAGLIAAVPVAGAAFGQLPAAAALGTTLTAFRDGHAELGRQVQAAHVELAGRAATAAGGGDQMVQDTTAQAGSVSPPPGIAP